MTLLKRATIKSYDAGTHQATIGIAGSLSVWLEGVPVDVGIPAAEVVAGRECAVVFFSDDNPQDSAIVSIHRAVPAAVSSARIVDADGDTGVETENTADEDKIRMTIAGTLRYVMQAAPPHHTLTGEVLIDEKLDVGNQGGLGGTFNAYHAGGAQASSVNIAGIGFLSTLQATQSITVQGLASSPTVLVDSTKTLTLKGLSFFASGGGAGTIGTLTSLEGRSFLSSGATVTNMQQFHAAGIAGAATGAVSKAHAFRASNQGAGAVDEVYHFRSEMISNGAKRRPFWDEGSDDDDDDGNRFYSNTGLFTLATSGMFGGGDGVLHVHDRRVAPSSNPSAGGILYSESGALKWRGSGGTVTTIAPA